jgi:ATP-dependent helicase/nuclease subunit A
VKRVEVVLASAGSGKTFTLTLRFAGLLLRGARPEEVLAATFTRKAAGEIQARILERLAGAAEGGKGLAELRKHLDWPDLEVGHCQEVLKRTVDALPRMQVLTLDSWFARLGRGLAPELGLDPGWRMLEEVEDEEFRIQALEEVLARGDRAERIALLRDLQRGRSEARVLDRLLRSVASAHARARWSVEGAWDHLAPGKPLDAAEFEALYREFEGLELAKTKAGADHSGWVSGRVKFLSELERQDWGALTGGGMFSKWVEAGKYGTTTFDDADPRWEPAFQRLRLHMAAEVLAEVARQNLALSQLLSEFGRSHDQILEREGGLRFDDLTWRLASAALGKRDFDLAYRLDTRLHHLLLDEYQDTNALQHAVLDRNLAEIASYGEEDRSLFVVGDPKQSIYGFREAEPRLLQGLGARLDLEPSTLATNWRSSPRVLEFVNRIFSRLSSAPFLDPDTPALRAAQAFEAGWEEHTAAEPNLDLPGRVRVWEAAKSDGNSDTEELLDEAVRLVAELRAEAPHARIAVLTRTGRFGVKLLARLAEEGIPAAGEGGRPLVDSHLVRCTLGLLRLADHPGDGLALALVLGSPLLGLFPDLDASGPLPELGRALSHRARAGIAEQGVGPWLAGLRERLEGIAPYDAERFEALLRIAHAWPESSRGRLAPLIAHLQEARTEGASDAQVRVLTIHASKGLEYDAVVLPELGGKMFETPSLVSRRSDAYGPVELLSTYQPRGLQCLDDGLSGLHEWDQEALLTDSLCMLYVAMTRAKRSLDLILPHWRPTKGKSGRAALPNTARWCHFVRFLGTAFEADPESPLLLQEASEVAWAQGIEPREEQPEPAPAPSLELRPGGAFRPLPTRSPSAAEGGQRRTVAEWLRGVDEGAVALGTCVHALLEGVEWGDSLDLARLGDAARAGQGSTGQAILETALELLDEALVAPELRSLLTRPDDNAELWRERRFAVELEGELWSGTFDRVVLHRDGEGALTHAEVVDWKTDRVSEDGLLERAEHYRPQLEAYGRVLAAMTGVPAERIALRLAFLRAGRVVDL